MEIKKPELTENEKKFANTIYSLLIKQQEPVTKEFICEHIGWEYNSSNDRKVRDLLSKIAKVKPLISTSDQKGYYIAKTSTDLEKVEHQWLEINKRVNELNDRLIPLINFIQKYEK